VRGDLALRRRRWVAEREERESGRRSGYGVAVGRPPLPGFGPCMMNRPSDARNTFGGLGITRAMRTVGSDAARLRSRRLGGGPFSVADLLSDGLDFSERPLNVADEGSDVFPSLADLPESRVMSANWAISGPANGQCLRRSSTGQPASGRCEDVRRAPRIYFSGCQPTRR